MPQLVLVIIIGLVCYGLWCVFAALGTFLAYIVAAGGLIFIADAYFVPVKKWIISAYAAAMLILAAYAYYIDVLGFMTVGIGAFDFLLLSIGLRQGERRQAKRARA